MNSDLELPQVSCTSRCTNGALNERMIRVIQMTACKFTMQCATRLWHQIVCSPHHGGSPTNNARHAVDSTISNVLWSLLRDETGKPLVNSKPLWRSRSSRDVLTNLFSLIAPILTQKVRNPLSGGWPFTSRWHPQRWVMAVRDVLDAD